MLGAYWWRLNGWGVCASGACTVPVGLYVYFHTDMTRLQYFPLLSGISLVATVAAAYLLPGVPADDLKNFYRKVRPFGAWGPVRRMLAAAGEDPSRPKQDRYALPIAFVGTAFFCVLYVLMMDLVLHNWPRVIVLTVLTLLGGLFLYVAWWRRLEPVEGEPTQPH